LNLQEGERAIVIDINGDKEFKSFLLTNGVALGSIVTKNYSPSFSNLTSFTIGGKILSLKNIDFQKLELIKI